VFYRAVENEFSSYSGFNGDVYKSLTSQDIHSVEDMVAILILWTAETCRQKNCYCDHKV